MSSRVAFQTQLASIMEVLANAAVLEVCKLVDDEYALLSLQMSQWQRENRALKRKLHLLELRLARRESTQSRGSRVQLTGSLSHKYRQYSTAPGTDIFSSQDELYGRQLNEELWKEGESSAADVSIGRPVCKDNENAVDAGITGADAVKAETSDEGHKRQELFIREDGVAEAVSEDVETGYSAVQVEKADGHHSRTRRQALEPQKTEDEEPDVLFIKEELSEQERTGSQTHEGMSVQDGFVESSTDICRRKSSSSPAQITVALGVDESAELDTSHMKEEKPQQNQKKITNRSAGGQIKIQSVVGSQTDSLHSHEPALPGGSAQIGVKVWDLPSAESQLQGTAETSTKPHANQSTQQRKMTMPMDVLGTNDTLYERPEEVESLFTRWTVNSSASQPSCSYVVDADQDQDCVLVQPGPLSVSGIQENIDSGPSSRLPDNRGSLRIEPEWTTAAISHSTQSQQLGQYSRTEGVRLEAANRASATQSIPKITMNSQMVANFNQPGFSRSGLQLPRRMEKGKRKSYICKYCGKAFTGLSNVEAHQRVHTGEKPFKCDTCGKDFAEAGNLKKHQRVHTGEKPFQCSRCGKRFAWICNLRTHQHSASCGGV